MFVLKDDSILVNEIAPRPHNSGHQTIVACDCSQFEQQVRVCAKLPLGETKLSGRAKLHNLLGDIWFVNNGVEKIVELNLSSQERENFDKSVEAVRDLFNAAKKIGKNNIIIHGNLTCSIISKIIGMNFPGKGSLILEQKVLFPNPFSDGLPKNQKSFAS